MKTTLEKFIRFVIVAEQINIKEELLNKIFGV